LADRISEVLVSSTRPSPPAPLPKGEGRRFKTRSERQKKRHLGRVCWVRAKTAAAVARCFPRERHPIRNAPTIIRRTSSTAAGMRVNGCVVGGHDDLARRALECELSRETTPSPSPDSFTSHSFFGRTPMMLWYFHPRRPLGGEHHRKHRRIRRQRIDARVDVQQRRSPETPRIAYIQFLLQHRESF